MTRRLSWPALALYVLLAFAITWLAWLPGILRKTSIFEISIPLTLLGGMGPAIAALVVTGLTEGREGLRWLGRRLVKGRVAWYWYPTVLFLPLVLAVLAMIAKNIATGTFPGFRLPAQSEGVLALVLTILVTYGMQTLLTGGNEELGWRGYMLPRLQAKFSAFTSSIILALIWAVWHLPLFVMKGTFQSQYPFYIFLLFTIPLTLVFSWVHNQTGGSVLMAMLFHGAVNTTAEYVRITMFDPAMLLTWAVAAVAVLAAAGPKRLTRRPESRADAA